MKINRSSAVADYRLNSRFETIRKKLLLERFTDRLQKPLAYWALPSDRRLPLAFLDRTLAELLDTPFEELYQTPGVGQKKIDALVRLLARAAKDGAVAEEAPLAEVPTVAAVVQNGHSFDPTVVSEAIWTRWRAAVARNDLGDVPLGRFAPSLERLPRVLWNAPLDTYLDLSLDEIRRLKTHGQKRVSAVLEVFESLYRVIGHLDPNHPGTLAVRIMPPFVAQIESWIFDVRFDQVPISDDALERQFLAPLLDQVRLDAGEQVADLAAGRLGFNKSGDSVREVARRLGLTRARIYQLLAEVGVIMEVRWPSGASLVQDLIHIVSEHDLSRKNIQQLTAAVDLFFPAARGEHAAELSDAEARGTSQRRAG